ncbi:guanylate kinase [Beduini massiliensis]|uniref:guanylate kinase n=1 Tax=Beduini massiliensis TaxID=1585974 RepID=UPI00059A9448|nr:guanylate kinase [Beduini massiliensis]
MAKGKLIILSGPSGVGKGTVRASLFEDESLNLAYSISMTTRLPRVGERDGIDYFFVSQEEFQRKIDEDGFLEYAQFVGNCYGTPKDYVDQLLNDGKNVVLEIEVQGALQVMKKCPEALTIFLVPPSMDELEKRIRGRRTEEEDIVRQRLDKAKREIATQNEYKYVVCNDDVEEAKNKIAEIIKMNANVLTK